MMGRSIGAIALVEFRRLLRSPFALGLLLVVPALQLALFGYAIRPNGASVTIAVAADSPGAWRDVTRTIAAVPLVTLLPKNFRPGAAEATVRAHRAQIGVEIPEQRSFYSPTAKGGPVRIVVDDVVPSLVEGTIGKLDAVYWRSVVEHGDMPPTGPGLQIVRLYNPTARADWQFLPALVGVTVMIAMIMLGTLSVARERETGVWEGLLALPVSRTALLAGKVLPYLLVGTLQGVLVLAMSALLFDLPQRGSIGALIALLPPFAAVHFVIGYAISSRAQTQLAALQGAVAFYLPAILLSGFLYPFEGLPPWARAIGNALPLTHFIRAARDATLRGAGSLAVLIDGWPIGLALLLATAVTVILQPRRLD
jgi:ABC-2 type transport system permease protein